MSTTNYLNLESAERLHTIGLVLDLYYSVLVFNKNWTHTQIRDEVLRLLRDTHIGEYPQ